MPKREGDRPEESVEDLFDDLDKFFEPIREPDWPQGPSGEPPQPGPPVPEGDVPPDAEWPEITVPDEAELLGEGGERGDRELTLDDLKKAPPQYADLPGPQGDAGAEAAGPVEGSAKDQPDKAAKGRKRGGAKRAAGKRTTRRKAQGPEKEAPIEPEAPPEGDEETLAAEFGMFEEPIPPEEPIEVLDEGEEAPAWESDGTGPETGEEEPDLEAVEAAAEHFAEGLRASPEEVEAELLADLDAPREEPGTVSIEPPAAAGTAAPASAGAPSWQEPGISVAETEEITPPPPTIPGRNLVAAFTTGVILAALALALLAWGKTPFAFLAGAVILLGQGELYAVMRMRGRQPATALGLVAGLFTVAGGYVAGEPGVLLGLSLAMLTSVLWYTAAPPAARQGTTVDVGATLLGVVYVPFLASFALVMLRVAGNDGRNLLLAVVGLTILYDILAYAVGSLWGSRALAPTVSPSKSWEGAIGATLGLLLVAIALVPSIQPFTPTRAVGLALIIAIFAPIGDLVESAFKRDLEVKDMSSILPGHGGILDRIDSILFTAPAAWYFFRMVILG
ncbi:MAG TPA: phosphatidate cytidylyltransferase [Actinomycetota bacterium]|jgi:phosphatidate cytidylyltransferase|nr:phosphatidate cytidylyltransferase [Actinomycetota bacterium]